MKVYLSVYYKNNILINGMVFYTRQKAVDFVKEEYKQYNIEKDRLLVEGEIVHNSVLSAYIQSEEDFNESISDARAEGNICIHRNPTPPGFMRSVQDVIREKTSSFYADLYRLGDVLVIEPYAWRDRDTMPAELTPCVVDRRHGTVTVWYAFNPARIESEFNLQWLKEPHKSQYEKAIEACKMKVEN